MGASPLSAAPGTSTAAAQSAAESWLKLTDAGQYGAAWDQAAQPIKKATTRTQFNDMLTKVRTPLGAVTRRTVKSVTDTTDAPGAPPGHYVIIQYTTSFAKAPNRTETVTPMLETDGKWRVSGYYIR